MIPIERHFIIGNAPNTGLEGSLARTGPRAGDLHGRLSKPKLNCWRLRHPSQARLMLSRVAAVEGVERLHDRGNKPPQGFKKHCATQCQNRLYVQEKKTWAEGVLRQLNIEDIRCFSYSLPLSLFPIIFSKSSFLGKQILNCSMTVIQVVL